MSRGRSPEILLEPAADFDVEVLDDGLDQEPDHSFIGKDAGRSSPADTLLLQVIPHDHQPWIARFEGGYPSPAGLTTVRTGPRSSDLLVVNKGSGFLIPVDDPASAIELDASPIVGIAVSRDDDVVVAADFTRVIGFGPEGRRWTAEVSWDGVELAGVQDGVVRGRGWDAPENSRREFAVDVRTGRVLHGVTPRP